MLYHIDFTRMLRGAKESLQLEKRPRSVTTDLLIFLLVAVIASVPQSILSFAITFLMLLFDPNYIELIVSSDITAEAIEQYQAQFIASLPSWYYAALLFASGFMIVAALLYCRIFEKRKPYTLGFGKKNCGSEYLLGAVIGFVMISIPVLVCSLTGCVSIEKANGANPIMIAVFLVAFIFQGMGEEALFRGYLMTSLSRKTNVWTAILLNSLLFSLFHLGNSSFSLIAFINIFLFGIFASVFMLKRGSIWAVGAIHSVWNFAQGNLFGFNVSGNPKFESLFTSTQESFGTILHGGDFGPEGGLGVTIVLLIAILGALLLPTKKSERIEEKTAEQESCTAE